MKEKTYIITLKEGDQANSIEVSNLLTVEELIIKFSCLLLTVDFTQEDILEDRKSVV